MSEVATANRLATFLNVLLKYRLVEPGKLDRLKGSPLLHGDDPRPLARQMGQWGWLTKYQLKALAAGQVRELAVGPYRILDCVGEGGMGKVFKAKHLAMNRIVALKVIRKELLADERQVKRFYQEVQSAAQLVHPHIMVAFDAGCDGERHYLAMEFAEGCDLSRLVEENGPLPTAQACEYIQQAALGLQYAHERGMVHRDIKPSNLFLARPFVPAGADMPGNSTRSLVQKPLIKVLDLGLARFQDSADEDTSLTRTGTVVGTPDFISPEQAQNSRAVDIRSDLYSLGCTFYFLLAARPPFQAQSAMDVMLLHYMEEATPIEQWRPDVPREVGAILRKLMAKRPEDRFQTPNELAAALEPFTAGGPAAPLLATPTPVTSGHVASPVSPVRQALLSRYRSALDRTDVMNAPDFPIIPQAAFHPSRRTAALVFLLPIVAALLFIGLWKMCDRDDQAERAALPMGTMAQQSPRSDDGSARPVNRRGDTHPARALPGQPDATAFRLRNLHVDVSRCKAGEELTLRYELLNTAGTAVRVPDGRLGSRQHWLERLGPDPLLPNPGSSARIGNRYAAGGMPIRIDTLVPPGKAFPYVRRISTHGFPPGHYRYHVEFRNDRGTVLDALWIDFEVAGDTPA